MHLTGVVAVPEVIVVPVFVPWVEVEVGLTVRVVVLAEPEAVSMAELEM